MKKEKTYYIYEIPGVKIGCTTSPKHRVEKEQGYSDYQIVAEFKCIYIASFMERFLQEYNGYPVDHIPYYKSVKNRNNEVAKEKSRVNARNLGKVTGKINGRTIFLEKKGMFGFSKEENFHNSSKGGITVTSIKYLCPDGKIVHKPMYRKYCINRGLDPEKAVKIAN